MILYFSGTGNSRYVAEMIGAEINDKVICLGDYIKKNEVPSLESDKPWVFVSPVYAWQIPRALQKIISAAELKGSKKAYSVITCGMDIGDAGYRVEKISKEKGFEYMGTKSIIMPENYIAMFDVPQKEKSDRIISSAKSVILDTARKIKNSERIEEKKIRLSDRVKSGIINSFFYKFAVKPELFKYNEKCIGCGKCAEDCVLNNIKMVDIRPIWGSNCTHCMACICGCPVEAIEYGKKTKGKVRYQCPEFKKDSIEYSIDK